ncbi:unnamed protein product [Euphydryas editha]|nr:unnamed protein product [Euphydryas editha]
MLCLVSGRNLHDLNEDQDIERNEEYNLFKNIKDSSNLGRHRRKSRQSLYGYSPYYYDNSLREYLHNQDEMLNRIDKLLNELSWYVKRSPSPPPQPQIVYIPYPVPYPMPQYRKCVQKQPKVNFTTRWPDLEDPNMNWGLVPVEEEDDNDDGDGSRPVSFEPVDTDESVPAPPPVEHGSKQAGMDATTRAPTRKPGACKAAIIVCCNLGTKREQRNCFSKYGCLKTNTTDLACSPKVITQVLDEFAEAYGINDNL